MSGTVPGRPRQGVERVGDRAGGDRRVPRPAARDGHRSGIDVFGHERLADELGLHPGFWPHGQRRRRHLRGDGALRHRGDHRRHGRSRVVRRRREVPAGRGRWWEAQAKMMCEPDFEFIYGAYIRSSTPWRPPATCRSTRRRESTSARWRSPPGSGRSGNPQAIRHAAGPISIDDVLDSRRSPHRSISSTARRPARAAAPSS